MPYYTFAEFLSDKHIRREVDNLVDQTHWELQIPRNVVDEVFPTVTYQSAKLLANKMQGRMTIASLIGPDEPVPNQRGRAILTEERLARLFIGQGHVWTHEEYEMLYELERYSRQGANSQATARALIDHIIGNAGDLPVAIDAKHLLMMFLLGCYGELDYTDPLTGFQARLEITDTFSDHLPPPPSTLWGQSSATGLAQIELICDAYQYNLGSRPAFMFAHYKELKDLSKQLATREQIGAYRGTSDGLADALQIPVSYDLNTYELNDGMLLQAIRDRAGGAIRVVVFEAKYSEEDRNGIVTDKYFLPEGFIMFARPQHGIKALLPYKENRWQPGVNVITEQISEHPLQERISGMTAGVPFFPDGRYIAAQQVGAVA